ncbi:MAG: hypothetical protein CVT92_04340 [Bacteroidetes bacterium HGW-Bacteroidetes-1]|nr:MAG: hypothetical protein CVT92_04340 [Bacteroidetes bacterium HGW-Bacteroidetes-1]
MYINKVLNLGLDSLPKLEMQKSCSNHQLYLKKRLMLDLYYIKFKLFWKPNESLGVFLEGDAMAVKQGRKEDYFIETTYGFVKCF